MVVILGGAHALHCLERSGSILREIGSGRGSLRLQKNLRTETEEKQSTLASNLAIGSLLLERLEREEVVDDMTMSMMSPRSLWERGVRGGGRWQQRGAGVGFRPAVMLQGQRGAGAERVSVAELFDYRRDAALLAHVALEEQRRKGSGGYAAVA